MNYDEAMNMGIVEFGDMPPQAFLLGLLSAFDNRYQASADSFFEEITWKQLLLKLEKKGFITFKIDENDKRKQRIYVTKACQKFCEKNDGQSQKIVGQIFNDIDEKSLMITIQTIMKMDKNLKEISWN